MMRQPLKDFDLPILVLVVVLCGIGVVIIYSSIQVGPEAGRNLYLKHLTWLGIGLCSLCLFFAIPLKAFYAFAYLFYALSLVLLLLPLLRGAGSFPARRWIDLGLFHFQPSEGAKLATVFALSRMLSDRKFSPSPGKQLIFPALIVLLPLLLVLVEPDLGTSAVFLVLLVILLYFRGMSVLHLFFFFSPLLSVLFAFHWVSWILFIVFLVGIFFLFRVPLFQGLSLFFINSGVGIVTPLAWRGLKEYQRQRLLSFLNPHLDPRGAGWQVIQSKIAIGSGGLIGKGLFRGTQKKLAFLPRQHTDFVFSVMGEELGMLGCLFILALFLFLIWRGMRLAREAKNPFSSLLVVGIATVFSFQVLLNVSMTLGIMPVVGIPLPFISYGGSSMLVSMAMVGLLLNVGKNRYEY